MWSSDEARAPVRMHAPEQKATLRVLSLGPADEQHTVLHCTCMRACICVSVCVFVYEYAQALVTRRHEKPAQHVKDVHTFGICMCDRA